MIEIARNIKKTLNAQICHDVLLFSAI